MTNYLVLMAPQGGAQSGGASSLIFLVLIMVVFYLFFIRPQMKKNKDLKKFREALKKGDKVITIGGIHGKILEMGETTVVIEVEGQSRLKLEKSAIAIDGSGTEQLAQTK